MPEGVVVRWDAQGGCCKVGCSRGQLEGGMPRGLLEPAMAWKGGSGDMECPRGPAMWSGVPKGAGRVDC